MAAHGSPWQPMTAFSQKNFFLHEGKNWRDFQMAKIEEISRG
jgi:hypothetical protein